MKFVHPRPLARWFARRAFLLSLVLLFLAPVPGSAHSNPAPSRSSPEARATWAASPDWLDGSSTANSAIPQREAVSGSGAGDGRWVEMPPPPRYADAAVVDTRGGRILLLGGFGWSVSDQMWQHAIDPNAQWKPFLAEGQQPTHREAPTAVYDPHKNRVLYFGGFDGQTATNELWELSLSGIPRWSLLHPEGVAPPGRLLHSAVVDTRQDRMLVFGGWTRYERLNDVWALSLHGRLRWEPLTPSGNAPSPRMGGAAVYDSSGARMLVLGGNSDPPHTSSENVWALDLSGAPRWTRLTPGGIDPGPLDFGRGVLDAQTNRVYFYDGSGTSVPVLSIGGSMAWGRVQPTGGGPLEVRIQLPIAVHAGRQIWVHGGFYGTRHADTWTLALDGPPVWTRVPSEGEPGDRTGHTTVFDCRRDRMILYGGQASWNLQIQTPVTHALWELDLAGGDTWKPIEPTGPNPGLRTSHTAIYDPLRDRMIIFGGASTQIWNDVWALSLDPDARWQPLATTGDAPSPRTAATAIYDPVGDRMILYGGTFTSDVWALPLSGDPRWQQLHPSGTPPSSRREHAAVYDPLGQRMLVFAGITADGGYANDVWALSLDSNPTWHQVIPVGPRPRPRQSTVAVFDSANARMIVHGGYDGTYLIRDAWELNLAGTPTWRELAPAGNPPVFWYDHAAILEPARDRMILFGDFGCWSLDWSAVAPGRSAVAHSSVESRAVRPAGLRFEGGTRSPQLAGRSWELRIDFPSTEPAVLEVHSISGRLLGSQVEQPTAIGPTVLELRDSARLGAGVYLLRIVQGRERAVAKVVVVR